MKKILGLTISAILIMAVVAFGTWAYFSDVEPSTSNAIAAGTLDLTLTGGSGSPNYSILASLSNKGPGDSGSGNVTIKNIGSMTGEFDVNTGEVSNVGGSGGSEYEDGVGHLGDNTTMTMWIDIDKSGAWNDGDIVLVSDGSTVTRTGGSPATLSAYYAAVNNYASKSWGGASGIRQMVTNDEHYVYIQWSISTSVGNQIQGDSFSFTVNFVLEQPATD